MALTVTPKTTRSELAGEITVLQKQLADMSLKHDEFRALVAKAAVDAKLENGWCDSGFLRAMENLGLKNELPTGRKRVTMVLDVELGHESGYDFSTMEDEEWVDAALEQIRDNYVSSYELASAEVSEIPN